MRRTRRRHVPPDLTSLFDVLFIVIFAALIRAAAAEHAVAVANAAAAHPPPSPTPVARDAFAVLRISGAGTATALEAGGRTETLDVPLVAQSRDPDVALEYQGDRSGELRACRIIALHLGVSDLAHHVVIFALDRRLAELPHALYEGLHRDVDRCLAEQHGLAVIVEGTP